MKISCCRDYNEDEDKDVLGDYLGIGMLPKERNIFSQDIEYIWYIENINRTVTVTTVSMPKILDAYYITAVATDLYDAADVDKWVC